MKKVVVGIHGLRNKPPLELLTKWWKQSILDGIYLLGKKPRFSFRLVYWANYNYEKPLSLSIKDDRSEFQIKEPYLKPLPETGKEISLGKKNFLDKLERDIDKILLSESGFSGWDKLADLSIKYMFKDLDNYYHGDCRFLPGVPARERIRMELSDCLEKHKSHKVCLIAHSMGSIIAYDVLMQNPHLVIDTFITIGSPLGIPVIVKKILVEHGCQRSDNPIPKTPENISGSWFNFSDIDDSIALNYNLADDFSPNNAGIRPVDTIVVNQYQYNNTRNHHKIYGYLQTKAVAEAIYRFLKSR